ncbi:isopentenyl-diphosphate Delta-isomerase [Corynebacterium caspium]|uniref:isopentenyl-diphosphate Delta-isomerase n=1 Tax=Corynebacterium caspium TaxID=234828 RepID=UPI000382C916|nr:isopentenyl-diphosphate Delta-isomerase [Corynebacterium caspium]WKD58883.1 Isopentenyl-diphosphate Delta-isomerase [Corynebacterium caspium DSM 44850]
MAKSSSPSARASETELVVLAAPDGTPTGTAPKASVHTADTPLHFAFSAFLQNSAGELLITRRALSKLTWPGVWTNSFCGHPGPDEPLEAAIRRRANQELGIDPADLQDIRVVLPDFRYRAVDSSGVVENEICPVFVLRLAAGAEINPVAAEVDSWKWVDPTAVFAAISAVPEVFSPWMAEELAHRELREAF